MKKFKLSIIITLLFSLLLSGCASSYSDIYSDDNYIATEEAAAYDVEYASEDIYTDYGDESVSYKTEGNSGDANTEIDNSVFSERKLIKNVYLSVETMDIESLINTIESRVNSLGGYISNSDISGKSSELKNCSMIIRIPAEKTDEFVMVVEDGSNVTSKSESVDDVTMRYTDLEAHKKALQTEYDSLLELMKKADSMEDIITIQSRLSDVRYEMESMESQLRLLQNQVSFSTVDIDIMEVSQPTPTKEETTWEMIGRRFSNNLSDAIETVCDFIIDLIVGIPGLIVFILFLIFAIIVIRLFIALIKFLFRKHSFKMLKPSKTVLDNNIIIPPVPDNNISNKNISD